MSEVDGGGREMEAIPYSKLKDTLKTGDIILFSGKYPISKMVERLEGSKWSHTAMVLRLPEYEEPLLYEATDLVNLPDLLTGDTITGPKVVDLKQRLLTYGDDLVPYEPPMYSVRRNSAIVTTEEVQLIKSLVEKLHGIPNPDEKQMIKEVILGRYFHIKTTSNDITCSAFIAYTFMQLGWIKGRKPINGFMPKDFSTDGHLKLQNIRLENELVIDINQ